MKIDVERFMSYVDKRANDECWPWTGGHDSKGYGAFKVNGKQMGAHRVSFIVHGKGDPAGMVVRHVCDNPDCVNPHHLLIGTHADNARDRVERGRGCHGDGHPLARLTADIVIEARQRRANGEETVDMAREYGVKYLALYRAIHGVTWKHVPGALPKPGKRQARGEVRRLTEEIVVEVRQRRSRGDTVSVLAREYGVGRTALHHAIYGDTWAHIPGALPRPKKRGSRA